MANKYIESQISREIEDYKEEYSFRQHDEEGFCHLVERHIRKKDSFLRYRLSFKKANAYEPQPMSRFNDDIDKVKVLEMITKCLIDNKSLLCENFSKANAGKIDISIIYPEPIGVAIIKGFEDTILKASRLVVVVEPSKERGRLLSVCTAYPSFDMDEQDIVDDLFYGAEEQPQEK